MSPSVRGPSFRWYVCGLLLLATTINYMDRQTLSNAAIRVQADLGLSNQQYGDLETAFGLAFAAGALLFGFMADRINVWFLYPMVLIAWSAMGLATGFTNTYSQLLLCRTLLGFFEAGHWPCALKTTQRLLTAKERTLGNSILQSGASIGAIITPQIIKYSLTDDLSSWRLPFQAIGAIGFGWAVLWLLSMRRSDLQNPVEPSGPAVPTKQPVVARSAWSLVRRIAVVIVVVLAINACWHLFRVWLPKFLQQGRGYSESFSLDFIFWYYIATDVGCILAGMASVWLIKRGLSTAMARWIVFTGCSMVTLLSVGVALTPKSNLLLIQLLFLAAGSLGLFPCYYALTQEISTKHLGKVTGVLGAIAWATSPMHTWFGDYIDTHHSFDLGFAIVGCLPLVAALFWLVVWDWSNEAAQPESIATVDSAQLAEPASRV